MVVGFPVFFGSGAVVVGGGLVAVGEGFGGQGGEAGGCAEGECRVPAEENGTRRTDQDDQAECSGELS